MGGAHIHIEPLRKLHLIHAHISNAAQGRHEPEWEEGRPEGRDAFEFVDEGVEEERRFCGAGCGEGDWVDECGARGGEDFSFEDVLDHGGEPVVWAGRMEVGGISVIVQEVFLWW